MNGPDYVALVIEWDEEPVEAIAETEVTRKTLSTRLAELPMRTVVTGLAAAAGAIGLAVWGVHRLRAA